MYNKYHFTAIVKSHSMAHCRGKQRDWMKFQNRKHDLHMRGIDSSRLTMSSCMRCSRTCYFTPLRILVDHVASARGRCARPRYTQRGCYTSHWTEGIHVQRGVRIASVIHFWDCTYVNFAHAVEFHRVPAGWSLIH